MKPPARKLSLQDETLEAMAAAWLALRDDGLTGEEEADFARWRQADPRHDVAVRRLEKTWAILADLKNFRPAARAHPDCNLLARRHGRKAPPFAALAAMTALLAVMAVAWWRPWSHPSSRPDSAPQEYTTTVNGYQHLALEDGSLVQLNADSRVRVSFSPEERRVELLRGEATFIVAKNHARPFWVEAGRVAVRAVGTVFNVRLDPRDIAVLVTEGQVEVEQRHDLSANHRGDRLPTLVTGEQLLVPTDDADLKPEVQSLSPDKIRETLAWQNPRLVFVETPLAEAVAEFNRHNQVQIELGDSALASLPVGGSYKAEDAEGFVRLLASDKDIVAERAGVNRLILRRPH